MLPPDVAARDWNSPPLVSRDGERAVVWLDGEQDIATVAVLADTLASVTSADDANLIVDLSGVTFMSTATIDQLIRGRNLLLGLSRNLTLRFPSKCARRLLDLCGLAGLVEPSEGAIRIEAGSGSSTTMMSRSSSMAAKSPPLRV
ncbi:MAG: STAS domain-containing protein [Actinobacteria bacterium]|nr:STAS domain-containing protein [Actinomycetota bacterium]